MIYIPRNLYPTTRPLFNIQENHPEIILRALIFRAVNLCITQKFLKLYMLVQPPITTTCRHLFPCSLPSKLASMCFDQPCKNPNCKNCSSFMVIRNYKIRQIVFFTVNPEGKPKRSATMRFVKAREQPSVIPSVGSFHLYPHQRTVGLSSLLLTCAHLKIENRNSPM